jgi:lysophospholipid acyltransferase (LPLAT)-like uncharacterized protein
VASFSSARELRSWDRFKIPRLFSRALLAAGEPILVPRDTDGELAEQCRRRLQESMLALRAEADRRLTTEPFESFPRVRGLSKA